MIETKQYTAKDFKSDLEVKWCAGCGDHAILAALQRTFPQLGVKQEDFAVISGIGCSSRLPYYMNTYGMHSIHGRASAIASGLKSSRPDLSVWQITGDGDALAIGGNHFIHVIRRNIDINIIVFNNEIYGLTKGQYSPTSAMGKITKSSPFGTIENPFKTGELVLGAQGRFFGRTLDGNIKHQEELYKESAAFSGTSVIEVLQNCVIFNHGTHDYITNKEFKDDRQIYLEHGKPMLFGKDQNKGLVLDGFKLKVAEIGKEGITADDILVHDAEDAESPLHLMLIKMKPPEYPLALGVIRKVKDKTYDELIGEQIDEVSKSSRFENLDELFTHGDTWVVE